MNYRLRPCGSTRSSLGPIFNYMPRSSPRAGYAIRRIRRNSSVWCVRRWPSRLPVGTRCSRCGCAIVRVAHLRKSRSNASRARLEREGESSSHGERALAKSRTQPQVGDAIGIRENNLVPVSFITRSRNAEGLVVATRQTDTPRPHWVIENLEDFDLRPAAARALRDPTLSRREAVLNHRELGPAYWILDAAQKYAAGRW